MGSDSYLAALSDDSAIFTASTRLTDTFESAMSVPVAFRVCFLFVNEAENEDTTPFMMWTAALWLATGMLLMSRT